MPSPAPFPSVLSTSGQNIVDSNGYVMPFLKGLCVQILNVAWTQADFNNMYAEGARIVRLVIFWDMIESPGGTIPNASDPNYLTNLDNAVQYAYNAGLYVFLDLYFGPNGVHMPSWAETVTSAPASATANYMANGQNITTFLANRYGNSSGAQWTSGGQAVCGFQVNEPTPDIQSLNDFLFLLFAEQVQMANWVRAASSPNGACAPQWIVGFSAGFGNNAITHNAAGSGQSSQTFTDAPGAPFTNTYSSTVASGSNGVNPSTAWTYTSTSVGGSGTLHDASATGAPASGLLQIAHGASTMLLGYAGVSVSSNQFTGVYWISGYTGTISTGDAVTGIAGTLSPGGNPNFVIDLHDYVLLADTTKPTTGTWDGRTALGAKGASTVLADNTTNTGGNNYTQYPPVVSGTGLVSQLVCAEQDAAFMASHVAYSQANSVPFVMFEWGWATYNGSTTWSGGDSYIADKLLNMELAGIAAACQWDYKTSTSGDAYAARPGTGQPGANPLTGWQTASDVFFYVPPVPVTSQGFPLDIDLDLQLGGTWTNVANEYVYNRSIPAFTIQRGRPDEVSQISPSQMSGQLNNRGGQFTSRNPLSPYYGQLNRNTPVRLSVPDSGVHLRMADDTVSYISCADASSLRITGSIDVRIDADLDNWAPSVLCSKWGATATSWALALNGDGSVTFTWYDGSDVNQLSTAGLAVMPLGRSMLRATLDASTGDVTFYTAANMTATQTVLAAITGAGSTSIASGSGQAIAVGDSDTYDDSYGTGGCQGRVYEFRLYSGIGVTLVADPVFTAQSEGATSFTDAQGNTWAVAGSCELSERSYRYHGEMASLPVAWDPSGRDIWVPFQAGGILRRLQQGTAPVWSAMRRGITSLQSTFDFQAYWPCEDSTDSASIASGLPGGTPMLFTGKPSFQGQAGTPQSDSIFACSAQLPQVQGSTWQGRVPHHSSATWNEGFLLAIPSGGLGANCALVVIGYTGVGNYVGVNYSTANGGTLSVDVGGAATITGPDHVNGTALWVVTGTNSSGTGLVVLPVGADAESTYTTVTTIGGVPATVTVNGFAAALSSTEIGHLWVAPGGPDPQTYASLLNAWAGETAGNRVLRMCTENSVSGRVYGYPDTSAVMGPQPIDTLVNILQECEFADLGMLYEPAEALGIGYRTLASLCSQSPAVTLSYAAAQVGDQEKSPVSLTSVDDDLYTRNDVTVTRQSGNISGSSYEVALNDGSPMSVSPPQDGGAGDYATSQDVNVLLDSQLPGIAGWMVHTGTCDEERYPQIVTGLHRPPIIAAGLGYTIQNVRIGGYIQIADTPAWLPPGPINQLTAGATETLTSFLFDIAWNGIPESPYEVAIAGTGATDSALAESSGTKLASGYSSTATSFSVDVTGSLWVTGAVSINVMIAGEEIEITNISGASSPQTFTVTRSVNGVVKSQASGAAIALAAQPIVALAG